MGVEMPQPFTVEEIDKKPRAVLMGFLIGLILLLCSVVGFLWNRDNEADAACDERVEEKNKQLKEALSKQIEYFMRIQEMKAQNHEETQQAETFRENTEPYVDKIYKNRKK